MTGSSVSAWISAGIVTFLSSVALATGVYGQTGGTVRGTVVDDQGVPMVDVSVSFVLQGGLAARFHITTNDNGLFRQLGLPPGTYRMTVGREGYTEQAQDVRVATRETVVVNVVLQPAELLVSEEERARRERVAEVRGGFDAGLAAIRAERYDAAITLLTAALEVDPNCPDCQYNIGIAHLRKKEYERAEAAFTTTLDLLPGYARAYQGLADVYSAQGKFDEAIEASAEATRLAGGGASGDGDASGVFGQGVALWNAGRIAEAKEQFEETLRLDPAHGEAHYFLGMAKLNEGLIAEAARELQAYLDREPDGRFAAQATGVLGQIQPDSCG